MITKAIKNALARKQLKGWEYSYWAIDLHETVLKPNWSTEVTPLEFYPLAKETLQLISKQTDIVLIMYTCSHPDEVDRYLKFFKAHDINFKYVNENPEVVNMRYGFFDQKPYFNVLFEDKAGFDAYEDWEPVLALLKELRE
ncbi:MAG: hypothetical protein AAFO69_04675 [Bacteroidota bacterium]